MHLYENGAPYTPPSGTTCLVGWRREGGAAGNYSTITESDETSTRAAYELEGSVLTVELSEDVCRLPGKVYLNVALQGTDGKRLHTWELTCQVEHGAVADSESGVILGAQLMCERATDLISQFTSAVVNGLTAEQLLRAMRPHPTFDEGVGEALEDLLGKLEG